jgi:hypothetical protein
MAFRIFFKSRAWNLATKIKDKNRKFIGDPPEVKNFNIEDGIDYENIQDYARRYNSETGGDFFSSLIMPSNEEGNIL